MKQHAAKSVPLGGIFWDGGAQQFIHKGTNGRWRDVLGDEESQRVRADGPRETGRAVCPLAGDGGSRGVRESLLLQKPYEDSSLPRFASLDADIRGKPAATTRIDCPPLDPIIGLPERMPAVS